MAACNQTFQTSGPVGREEPSLFKEQAVLLLAFTSLQASCKWLTVHRVWFPRLLRIPSPSQASYRREGLLEATGESLLGFCLPLPWLILQPLALTLGPDWVLKAAFVFFFPLLEKSWGGNIYLENGSSRFNIFPLILSYMSTDFCREVSEPF